MARIGLSEAAKKRVKAGRMLLAGKGCTEVALAVDVARQTVYTCKRLLNEGGIDALGEVPERGCPAQLDGQQLAALRKALLQSPTEHGFGTELWTLKRVRAVIESQHGVRFSQVHVWRILGAMGFSAMKMPCAIGSATPGPGSKKSPARRSSNCFCRRVRHQGPRGCALGLRLDRRLSSSFTSTGATSG